MGENTGKNTGKRHGIENLKPPFKKGESGNLNGRPLGQRNYATIYKEALKKIAAANNLTPEEFEEKIEQVGLKKAFAGDFRFFQDIRDRVHGKALQKQEIDITAKVKFDEIHKTKSKSAFARFRARRNT